MRSIRRSTNTLKSYVSHSGVPKRVQISDTVSYLDDKDREIKTLQDVNHDLQMQLKILGARLDDLMLKAKQKQLHDDKI